MIPEFSAGSNQIGASDTCTPQISCASGPAAIAEPGPYLLNVKVTPSENVYPMVPPGAALSETIDQPRYEEVLS